MCGKYGQYELELDEKAVEKNQALKRWVPHINKRLERYNPSSRHIHLYNRSVAIGQDNPEEVFEGIFAWTAEKKTGGTWPVFNVRAEGGWINKGNNPSYDGPYQIWKNPYVEDIIHEQRCLIPVDFFVEQPEDKKKYGNLQFVVRKPNKKVIWLGGVYNDIVNEGTGEVTRHFAIITTPATPATALAYHHRCPLIVPDIHVLDWLSPNATEQDLEEYFRPADTKGWEVYQVDDRMGKRKIDWDDGDPRLIEPKGEVMVADG